MTRRSRSLFSLILLLVVLISVQGDQIPTRTFDEVAMEAYQSDGDFSYMNMKIRPPSIWQRLQWWFSNLITRIIANPNAPWISNVIFYALLLLVLGVAIFYIIRLRYGGALAPTSKKYASTHSQSVRSSSTADFDRLMADAVNSENYKLAIRYLYLKTLSFLSDRQLVKLKDWKSPSDYERELSEQLIPLYQELSHLFEYVWYGDFSAKPSDFEGGTQLLDRIKEVAG